MSQSNCKQIKLMFSSIGQELSNKIPDTNKDYKNYLKGNFNNNTLFNSSTDPIDVISTKSLKSKTSTGIDISTKIT